MTKQLAMFGTAVMTTLLAVVVLWQFRVVVVYVLISLALAATVRPIVMYWARHGSIKRAILIMSTLVSLGVFSFLFFLSVQSASNEIEQLVHTVFVEDKWRLPVWLANSSFQQTLVAQLPAPSQLFEAVTGNRGQLVLPAIVGLTQGIGDIASAVLVIFFLSIYWSINQIHFERLWLSLLPSGQRKQARSIWRMIEPDLGAYIRSELFQSLLAAFLLGIGYWLFGSPYPILLALTGGLLWLIPVIGAPLAVILPLLLGLLTSLQFSVITVIYTLFILIALQVWIEPRLFRRTWDNPILTLLIILVMADAFGLVGILIAPPLSAVCQILWSRLVSRRAILGDADQVSDLKERQVRIWETINAISEPPMLLTSSMERLTELIAKAEPILKLSVEPREPFRPFPPLTDENERK